MADLRCKSAELLEIAKQQSLKHSEIVLIFVLFHPSPLRRHLTRLTFSSLISDMETVEIYHDVKQIHYTHRIAEANAYLELGWRLLKVLAKRDKDEYAGYVLGWPHDKLAQHPKEDFSDSVP